MYGHFALSYTASYNMDIPGVLEILHQKQMSHKSPINYRGGSYSILGQSCLEGAKSKITSKGDKSPPIERLKLLRTQTDLVFRISFNLFFLSVYLFTDCELFRKIASNMIAIILA